MRKVGSGSGFDAEHVSDLGRVHHLAHFTLTDGSNDTGPGWGAFPVGGRAIVALVRTTDVYTGPGFASEEIEHVPRVVPGLFGLGRRYLRFGVGDSGLETTCPSSGFRTLLRYLANRPDGSGDDT